MKNPRLTTPADSRPGGLQLVRRTAPALAFLDGAAGGPAIPAKPADGLTKTLEYLKFEPSEIARITSLVGAITSMATIAGFAVGAISTAKQLLTMLGVLDTPEDPSVVLLKRISAKVEQIYKYLEATSKKLDYEKAVDWRTDTTAVRNALVNLTQSRSTTNVDLLAAASISLQRGIEVMLNPATGQIAFHRSAYGATGGPTPDWVDVATPFFMGRGDGTQVDYRSEDKDLATQIWDPGFYFDVMVEAIAMRLAALVGLEPAFRSTGHDRENLRQIHSGLKSFLDTWNRSRISTRIVGPLDPAVDPFSGGHRIQPNWTSAAPSIPLGVIDPLSGVTAFLPGWSTDLEPDEISNGPLSSYWVTRDFDGAVASAAAQQSAMFADVHAACGVDRVYELMHSVFTLIVGPGGSEFVDLSDPGFAGTGLSTSGINEPLTLGFVGSAAGQPGREYSATRYHQQVTKTFRTPLARRADASQIQLGYRLVVDVGGGPSGRAEVVLCPFSTAAFPGEDLPLFPTEPIHVTLDAPQARVYDMVQSAVFSPNDEDMWERTGTVSARIKGEVHADLRRRERLLVAPRTAPVRLGIDVVFDFDAHHPDHPFLGTATVRVTTDAAAAVVAHVEMYETVVAALENGSRDERQEELADTMSLHLASTFSVVESDYFTDRAAGLAALDESYGSVSEKYARFKATLGPLDRVHELTRRAMVEQELEQIGIQQLEESPHAVRAWLSRRQVPVAAFRVVSPAASTVR